MGTEFDDRRVIVAGAGAVYEEKVNRALDRLGSSCKRVVLDKDLVRVASAENGQGLVADALRPLFFIPETLSRNIITFISIPEHLKAIESFHADGMKQFIVEKPLVNNAREVQRLTELIHSDPELKIYGLDFYLQKLIPLSMLTGRLTPDDPRWKWTVDEAGGEVDKGLCGSLEDLMGGIEGGEVTILEGGTFGLPDLAKREWLETDKVRGGMLLDLGTHALAPLIAAGIVDVDKSSVVTAQRVVLGDERKSFVPAKSGDPEIYAEALLSLNYKDRLIPLKLTVGKTFHEGGLWSLVVRGSKGFVFMGLRSGDSLTVVLRNGETIRIKLRPGKDPYELAFDEAMMYFGGYPGFDGNLGATMDSIKLIDEIKLRSHKTE